MNGKDILALQLSGSFNLITERLRSPDSARHWAEPAFEGGNAVGFTLWHCTRTIDWGVQCAIRGVDEVARRPEWSDRIPGRFRFGAGIAAAAAQDVAAECSPELVGAYLEAVQKETLGWLNGQTESALDVVPDFRAHNEQVGYTEPDVWAEIDGLEGLPVWQVLARPCISHIRVHIGEVGAVLQSLMSSPPD